MPCAKLPCRSINMVESWDMFMFGLTGLSFTICRAFTLNALWHFNVLSEAPHLSIQELFNDPRKFLNQKVFLYGTATATTKMTVTSNQPVVADNYPSVIYSHYIHNKENQFNLDKETSSLINYGSFNLTNPDGSCIEVKPTPQTYFCGYKVFKRSGYIELSWLGIVQSLAYLVTDSLSEKINDHVAYAYQ